MEKEASDAISGPTDEPTRQRIREWLVDLSGGPGGEKEQTRRVEREEKRKIVKRGRPTNTEILRREGESSVSSEASVASWLSKRHRDSGTEEEGEETKKEVKKKKSKEIKEHKRERRVREGEMENMEKIREIVKSLLDLQKEEIIKEMNAGKEELKKELEKYKRESEERDKEREQENEELRREIALIKRREEERDRRERKRNIIIRGVKNSEEEAKQVAVEIVRKLGEECKDVKVREALYIGREDRKVILVEMEKLDDKRKMMRNKSKLRGSGIFVDDDLTKEEREMQKSIREWSEQERRKGKKVKGAYGRAFVNGEGYKYMWDRERKCMESKFFRKGRTEQ